ncbi:hypothetical protein VTL71DRAFT_10389 [Oculimacula yallundae]|uniref:Alpha-acetolactate decarboxylase n=1 Tax=Oculimacula yallundae TaxID=86028 RepID=A0ABR4CSY5_9HELO
MDSNALFQFSTFDAIMGGIGDHGSTVNDLLRKGDHGLGTFRQMCGEMVMIDGETYQVTADEGVIKAEGGAILPFAQVTRFSPSNVRDIDPLDKISLSAALQENHPASNNLFVSIRIDGNFEQLSTHIVRQQKFSGQPGSELLKNMKHDVLKDISGTAFGFRSPNHAGFSPAGLHLHFISADRQFGGHVIDFRMLRGTLGSCVIRNIQLEFPTSEAFNEMEFVAQPKASNQ